ncbi:MAG: riboflavin synthase subunit alpha [Proteobacteria bacterium]|nr:riboflavin synthase subunit alpha [Pseudomonadota bacterium]
MFTGIVQGLCRVSSITDEPGLRRICVELGSLVDGLAAGASVALNGTCLTATSIDRGVVSFDVILETVARSNLGQLKVGVQVNIERSLKFGDEIGGHVLSGHVTDIATVVQIDSGPNERTLWLEVSGQWMPYLFHKGFVALDGASLTIAAVDRPRHRISVSLIPETIGRTTLGRIAVHEPVNLELDAQTQAIVTTVERLLSDPDWRRELRF